MIARLGSDSIMYKHGMNVLTSGTASPKSWFLKVKTLCHQYDLPDPIRVLLSQPSKEQFKSLTNGKVLDWWNKKYRAEKLLLSSLSLFRADFMSLSQPYPIWTTAGSSPFEVRKATVQARMLSGRYRTCWLRRHWSGDSSGNCCIPGCGGVPGTLQHLVTGECPALSSVLDRCLALWSSVLTDNPILIPVVHQYCLGPPETFLSFLVDPTTISEVISLSQEHGLVINEKLCYMTRTWLFLFHKERLKLLNIWTK